ncbi:MAG TPA: alpha/beta fold hydrolase [Kofleriaceae bacterium]|nr:alpha/beta fold hydrolase [Kofleriaceae bacterium]
MARISLPMVVLGAALAAGCPGQQPGPAVPTPPTIPASEPAVSAPPESERPTAASAAVSRTDDGTLLLEGTPPIPEALRAAVEPYLQTRSADLLDLTDDGKQALIATRFGETSQLHLVRTPLGARTQLTFRAEPVSKASFVPGAAGHVIYVSDRGGDEKTQLFRLDRRTGASTMLTDGKARNDAPVWSADGKRFAYMSSQRNQVDFDVWVSNGTGAGELLVQGSGYWYPLSWSTDGKRLLVGEYVSITESRIYLVDVGTRKVDRLSPEDQPGAYRSAVLSRDGKKAYVISDREGEFAGIFEVTLATSSWKPLTRHIPWDVEHMDLSPSGRTLAFVSNEGGLSVLRLFDTRTGKETRAPGIPAGVIDGLGFARKAEVLGFSLAGASRTGDVYTYELAKKKLTRWTESEIGGLDESALTEPTVIKYKTFDGAEIQALYYRPAGQGPFPVVVSIHGGPEAQSRPWFSPFTQYMVGPRATAVLYPNVRGSTGYGKTFTTLDNGMKREDSVKDIGALLDWIGAQPELDAQRVGVIGGSYGGYMVLAALARYSSRIRAGVDVVGISNFVTFLENTGDYRRDLRRAEYGDERDPAMRKHLEAISPTTNVASITSALFVAQGANDPRVPASEAEQIVEAVRANGKDVWFMLARNEGHGFAKKSNRDIYLLLSILFFENHLGPQPAE